MRWQRIWGPDEAALHLDRSSLNFGVIDWWGVIFQYMPLIVASRLPYNYVCGPRREMRNRVKKWRATPSVSLSWENESVSDDKNIAQVNIIPNVCSRLSWFVHCEGRFNIQGMSSQSVSQLDTCQFIEWRRLPWMTIDVYYCFLVNESDILLHGKVSQPINLCTTLYLWWFTKILLHLF